MSLLSLNAIFVVSLLLLLKSGKCDHFSEELLIKPLRNGFTYAHFQFATTTPVNDGQSKSLEAESLFHWFKSTCDNYFNVYNFR